jgi:hypothetical protein
VFRSVALVMQHARCMRRIVLSSVPCPALQWFSTLSHKRHDGWKNATEHKISVFISSTMFIWNISHSNKNRERYEQTCILVFVWSTLYSCSSLMKLEFSHKFFEKSQKSNLMKNLPLVAKLFHADRLTDGRRRRTYRRKDRYDEANISYSQFFESALKHVSALDEKLLAKIESL